MKPFVVVADGMDEQQFAQLQGDELFEAHPKSKVSAQELRPLLEKLQALVIRSATQVNRELIESAPLLRYVLRAGEGTDNIDKVLCKERGIAVSNTPGANNNSAAEHAVALMMSTLRHIPAADHSMKSGKWEKSRLTGLELWKKRVGIVGLGRVGQIVAKRLQGFEVEVLFFDPFLSKAPQGLEYCRKATSLEEIFSSCAIVTIHIPLMEQTQNLITCKLLNLMGGDSVLVNAARGKIVDEGDLHTCLAERKIRAAAFDVFANEPLPEDSPLRSLDNFIMTPHLGASTAEAQSRVGQMVVGQLREFFARGTVLNQVAAP